METEVSADCLDEAWAEIYLGLCSRDPAAVASAERVGKMAETVAEQLRTVGFDAYVALMDVTSPSAPRSRKAVFSGSLVVSWLD